MSNSCFLYWDIGRAILDRQAAEGWGAKIIPLMSKDLQNAFPGAKGFSTRNLGYAKRFAEAWERDEILQEPLAKLSWFNQVSGVIA